MRTTPTEETTSTGVVHDDTVMDSTTVLPLVLYGTTAVYVVSGVLSMLTRPNLYDQVGQGGLVGSREECRPDGKLERSARLATDRAERNDDACQMLQACSERRVRQGLEPLDIDAELARLDLLDASIAQMRDADLVEEIRLLVILRNERRIRESLAALDVDAEIERTLAELTILGSRSS
jgi:hypothetical protein